MSDFLVDLILPTNEIHLVAGPSGAGKTTWLLQFIDSWRQGQPFLEHVSHPLPFVYLSADRSERSVHRVFSRLKLSPSDFRVETASSLTSHNLFLACDALRAKYPDLRVLFIEGFQAFTPGHKMNDYGVVATFLTSLLKYCILHNLTIVGICHATKTKKDETYENPRQKINGSVAWAAYSETIIFIEPADASDPNNRNRKIHLLPRNSAERAYLMEFRDGALHMKTKPLTSWERMEKWLTETPVGKEMTSAEIMAATGTARSTLTLDLSRAVQSQLLEPVKQGVYRRVASA